MSRVEFDSTHLCCISGFDSHSFAARPEKLARPHNDQAHPPPEAGATGGTTKAQAVGGRVQRLVRPVFETYALSSSGTTAGIPDQVAIFKMCATNIVRA